MNVCIYLLFPHVNAVARIALASKQKPTAGMNTKPAITIAPMSKIAKKYIYLSPELASYCQD
jgi:hypothetical protein